MQKPHAAFTHGDEHMRVYLPCAEALDEPPALLKEATAAAGLAPDAFITLQHGARMEVAGCRLMNQPPQLPVAAASGPV